MPPRQSGKPSSRTKSSSSRKAASPKSTTRTRKPAATTSSDAPTGEGLREQLQRILNPLELVVLTRERVQGALDEAVERGRMTRQDASDLAAELLARGRRQTDDLLAELEGLLGRSLGAPGRPGDPRGRPRAPRRRDRAVVPDLRLRRPHRRQVQARLGELSPPELRKVRDYERRNANRKSVLGGDRAEARLTAWHPCHAWAACPSPPSMRPARGDELDLTVETLAYGGNGVARRDGYVVFVAGGAARRQGCARSSPRASAPTPRRAPSRCSSPRRTACRRVADHPGAPWQVLPYERQLEVKAAQVAEALERIGHLEGFELEPIVPAVEQWRYRNKLEYSFGTGRTARSCAASTRPGASTRSSRSTTACWPPSAPTPRASRCSPSAARTGCRAWDRRAQEGFLRNLVVREGRRTGQLQVRLVTSPGKLPVDELIDAVDCEGLLWTQTEGLGESTAGGETTLLAGAPQLLEELGGLRSRSPTTRSSRPTPRWPSGSTRVAAEFAGAARPRARLRPLLRDRHDRR